MGSSIWSNCWPEVTAWTAGEEMLGLYLGEGAVSRVRHILNT